MPYIAAVMPLTLTNYREIPAEISSLDLLYNLNAGAKAMAAFPYPRLAFGQDIC